MCMARKKIGRAGAGRGVTGPVSSPAPALPEAVQHVQVSTSTPATSILPPPLPAVRVIVANPRSNSGNEALRLARELASHPRFDAIHRMNKSDGLVYPYHDDFGYPTQGFGHLLSTVKYAKLDQWPPMTKEECEAVFERDLSIKQRGVRKLVTVMMSPQEEAALIDFAFNLGEGKLKTSTLLRKLNRGDDREEVAAEFPKWNKGGNPLRPLAGLTFRRSCERKLFLS